MKKQLIVLYEEDKINPKNTWSGTSYQLRESLNEYYDVIFIDSKDSAFASIIKKISKKIERKTASYFFKPLYEKLHEIEINNKLKQYKDIPVLEICENVIVKNDFYLYRDMAYACYEYVHEKLKNDQNNYGHGMLNSLSKKALENRIKREEKLEEKAKGIFFMGQWVVDLMKDKYPNMKDKFIYAGGGLNNEFVEYIKPNKEIDNTILFVGIDFKRKGGELLLKTFKILKEQYNKEAKLIIAGSNEIKKEEGITVLGKVDRKILCEYFNNSTVFCMPSRFEAYGLVFIEALCFGLPIVSYDDFEMHYFVNKDNGYLINEYDEKKLAEALNEALNNKSLINNVKNNSSKYINDYSWSNVSKRIYEIIK